MKQLSQWEVQEVSGGVETSKPIAVIVSPLPEPVPPPPTYWWIEPLIRNQP